MSGINRLIEVLATIGKDAPTRRGAAMKYFYNVLHRRAGEDICAWVVRFSEAKGQMDEEVPVP